MTRRAAWAAGLSGLATGLLLVLGLRIGVHLA